MEAKDLKSTAFGNGPLARAFFTEYRHHDHKSTRQASVSTVLQVSLRVTEANTSTARRCSHVAFKKHMLCSNDLTTYDSSCSVGSPLVYFRVSFGLSSSQFGLHLQIVTISSLHRALHFSSVCNSVAAACAVQGFSGIAVFTPKLPDIERPGNFGRGMLPAPPETWQCPSPIERAVQS